MYTGGVSRLHDGVRTDELCSVVVRLVDLSPFGPKGSIYSPWGRYPTSKYSTYMYNIVQQIGIDVITEEFNEVLT